MKDKESRYCRAWMVLPILLLLAIVSSGCTTTYWADRRNDAADVITVSAGEGFGVKARAGPVSLGVLWFQDCAGIRAGTMGVYEGDCKDLCFIVPVSETCKIKGSRTKDFVTKGFYFRPHSSRNGGWTGGSIDLSGLDGRGLLVIAAVAVAIGSITIPTEAEIHTRWSFFSEVESVAAFGPGLRLGINPAEFVDFLLGFVGIDLFQDDMTSL